MIKIENYSESEALKIASMVVKSANGVNDDADHIVITFEEPELQNAIEIDYTDAHHRTIKVSNNSKTKIWADDEISMDEIAHFVLNPVYHVRDCRNVLHYLVDAYFITELNIHFSVGDGSVKFSVEMTNDNTLLDSRMPKENKADIHFAFEDEDSYHALSEEIRKHSAYLAVERPFKNNIHYFDTL